jgi:urease accessory protein
MIRAITVEPGGARQGLIEDHVVLDYDARFRRRITMTSERGLHFLLDLERAVALRDRDVLRLEDGRRIAVVAAMEPLAKIRCDEEQDLLRISWHLGNRHLPIMLREKRIYIRRDHVIEEMVLGLGGIIHHVSASFDPERGAYADAGHGGHGHSHRHGHDHD